MRAITIAIAIRDRLNISRIGSFASVAVGGGIPYPGEAREGWAGTSMGWGKGNRR